MNALCVLIGALFPPACDSVATHAIDVPRRFDPACIVVDAGQLRQRAADPHALHPYPRPPAYPPRAVRDRVTGSVAVRLQVSAAGDVVAAEVARAEPAGYFEEAALRAAQRWTFEPHAVDGLPVCVTFVQNVEFRFADPQ